MEWTNEDCVDRQTDYCPAAEGGYDCSLHKDCEGCRYNQQCKEGPDYHPDLLALADAEEAYLDEIEF
jgi:hypothetical protein